MTPRRLYAASHATGLVALAAAVSTTWLGQHMLIWTGILAALLVTLTTLAETTPKEPTP